MFFDKFRVFKTILDSPAEGGFSITPSDDDLETATRAIYVGGLGDLVIETISGDTITFANVPPGSIIPIRCKKVKAASTAENIVGLT